MDLIRNKQVIKKLRVNPLEDGEEWKVGIIEELSLCRRGCLEIELKDDDIDAMLEAIAIEWPRHLAYLQRCLLARVLFRPQMTSN